MKQAVQFFGAYKLDELQTDINKWIVDMEINGIVSISHSSVFDKEEGQIIYTAAVVYQWEPAGN